MSIDMGLPLAQPSEVTIPPGAQTAWTPWVRQRSGKIAFEASASRGIFWIGQKKFSLQL
jgi:hypothetical protein